MPTPSIYYPGAGDLHLRSERVELEVDGRRFLHEANRDKWPPERLFRVMAQHVPKLYVPYLLTNTGKKRPLVSPGPSPKSQRMILFTDPEPAKLLRVDQSLTLVERKALDLLRKAFRSDYAGLVINPGDSSRRVLNREEMLLLFREYAVIEGRRLGGGWVPTRGDKMLLVQLEDGTYTVTVYIDERDVREVCDSCGGEPVLHSWDVIHNRCLQAGASAPYVQFGFPEQVLLLPRHMNQLRGQDPVAQAPEWQPSPEAVHSQKQASDWQRSPESVQPREQASEWPQGPESVQPQEQVAERRQATEQVHPQEQVADWQRSSESVQPREQVADWRRSPESVQPREQVSEWPQGPESDQPQEQVAERQQATEQVHPQEQVSDWQQTSESVQSQEQASEWQQATEQVQPREQASEQAQGLEPVQSQEQVSDWQRSLEPAQPQEQTSDWAQYTESVQPREQASERPETPESAQPQEQVADWQQATEQVQPQEQAPEWQQSPEPVQPREQVPEWQQSSEAVHPQEQASEWQPSPEAVHPQEQASEWPQGPQSDQPREQASERPETPESAQPQEQVADWQQATEQVQPRKQVPEQLQSLEPAQPQEQAPERPQEQEPVRVREKERESPESRETKESLERLEQAVRRGQGWVNTLEIIRRMKELRKIWVIVDPDGKPVFLDSGSRVPVVDFFTSRDHAVRLIQVFRQGGKELPDLEPRLVDARPLFKRLAAYNPVVWINRGAPEGWICVSDHLLSAVLAESFTDSGVFSEAEQ